jgi:hypothetical protein
MNDSEFCLFHADDQREIARRGGQTGAARRSVRERFREDAERSDCIDARVFPVFATSEQDQLSSRGPDERAVAPVRQHLTMPPSVVSRVSPRLVAAASSRPSADQTGPQPSPIEEGGSCPDTSGIAHPVQSLVRSWHRQKCSEQGCSSPAPPIRTPVVQRKPAFLHGSGVSGVPEKHVWCCPEIWPAPPPRRRRWLGAPALCLLPCALFPPPARARHSVYSELTPPTFKVARRTRKCSSEVAW